MYFVWNTNYTTQGHGGTGRRLRDCDEVFGQVVMKERGGFSEGKDRNCTESPLLYKRGRLWRIIITNGILRLHDTISGKGLAFIWFLNCMNLCA